MIKMKYRDILPYRDNLKQYHIAYNYPISPSSTCLFCTNSMGNKQRIFYCYGTPEDGSVVHWNTLYLEKKFAE